MIYILGDIDIFWVDSLRLKHTGRRTTRDPVPIQLYRDCRNRLWDELRYGPLQEVMMNTRGHQWVMSQVPVLYYFQGAGF